MEKQLLVGTEQVKTQTKLNHVVLRFPMYTQQSQDPAKQMLHNQNRLVRQWTFNPLETVSQFL